MAANRFDDMAATWDTDPAKVERADAVADAVRAAVPLGPGVRMLEYGPGTGLVSQALQDSVGPITLADSSAGMLEVLRDKVAAGAIADARVWDFDLSRDAVPDERFDLIVTSMVLHHIPDVRPALEGFAALTEPGGRLCVADLEHEDGSFHEPDFEGHHGFDRDDLAARLEAAGFEGVTFRHCYEITRPEGSFPLFLATCTRQATTSPRA